MEKNRAVVRIAGQELRISGDESEEYIKTLAVYVDKKIDEVQELYPNISMNSCVVLAALNIADELHKLQANYDALDSRIAMLRDMPRVAAPAAPVKKPFESKEPVTAK